jgi:hypothetical protein
MPNESRAGRVALTITVGVVAFAAGAATVAVVSPTTSTSADRGETPVRSLTPSQIEQFRASYDKLAEAQMDMQTRVESLQRELEEARARLRVAESAKADEKWEPTPTDKPSMVDSDGSSCVVQAVDNKNNICVISHGSNDGVEQGMEFVVRRGAETIGSIVIDRVFRNYASGARKPGAAAFALAAGDVCTRVATPASKYIPPK